MLGENDGGWRHAETLEDMAQIFSDRYFWTGYRDAYDGVPSDYDETFGELGDAGIERAQIRYEDGYHTAVMARAAGVDVAWRQRFPLPVKLMAWALEA